MFLDILEFRVENKKKIRKNYFSNVVSDLLKNGLKCNCKVTQNSLQNLDFHGVNFGRYALCDTIFTCFQTFWSFEQRTKKMFRENCFENVVSEIYQKNQLCPQNPPKIVNVFIVFCFYSFQLSHFFLKVVLWTHKPHFFKSETTLSKQFSQNNFFLFSTVNSKMSRNMCKFHPKVRNGHFYPMKFQISSISKLFFKLKF